MEKVGFIIEKNGSPLWIENLVSLVPDHNPEYVTFRLGVADFRILFLALKEVSVHKKNYRFQQLVDLFHSIYTRI